MHIFKRSNFEFSVLPYLQNRLSYFNVITTGERSCSIVQGNIIPRNTTWNKVINLNFYAIWLLYVLCWIRWSKSNIDNNQSAIINLFSQHHGKLWNYLHVDNQNTVRDVTHKFILKLPNLKLDIQIVYTETFLHLIVFSCKLYFIFRVLWIFVF